MFPYLKKSFLALALCGIALVARPQAATVPGDILVMLQPGASAKDIAADLSTIHDVATDVRVVKEVSAPMRTWLYHFDTALVSQAVMRRAFQVHRGVALAQDNHIVAERSLPNDPQFGQQWQHQNIQSELAWNITTGGLSAVGDTIVVAIIENCDLPHPDLAANAWINHGEIPGNGIDDDGNGYVDDVRGWNPAGGNDNVYGGSHGTEVAGMIGAVGNNGLQVAGANWHVKMMPVKYASTAESDVIAAYTYPLVMRRLYNSTAGAKGAFVVATNASWGVDNGHPSDAPIWCAIYDTLGTTGVLNCGATSNNNVNVDVVGDLPTACPSDFMISVTATNSSDIRTFSGYGATTIDVGAPGDNIFTTTLGGGTGTASGTSFASPLTAGVIALMYSVPCASLAAIAHNDPEEAARRVRLALFAGVDHVGNLPGNTVTGGRINAFNSLQVLLDSCPACPAPYNLAANSPTIGTTVLSWSALPGTYTVRYRAQGASTWTLINGISDNSQILSDLLTCQAYEFEVSADCGTDQSSFSPARSWTSEGCCTAPLTITTAPIDTASAAVSWTTVLASTNYDLRFRELGASAWTEINGLTGNSTVLTGLSGCSDNEVQMRSSCGGTLADWSPSTNFHVIGCGQCAEGVFCASQGANVNTEWIAHVQIGTIDRTSAADGGYADADVTGQGTEIVLGENNTIILAPGYVFSQFPEYFTVWMDLDRNGQFTPDELVYDAGNTTTTPITGTINIPVTVAPGSARMRVVMKYNAPPPNGCTDYDFGETEDYCVSLVTTPSGIMEASAQTSVRVYPQPASDQVSFSTGITGPQELSVLDATGRTLLKKAFRGGLLEMPIGTLANGVYLYRLQANGHERGSGTFMVVH